MAAKPIPEVVAKDIVADWRTGAFSQQELADKHKVSKGAVNKLCKGIEQDTAAIVTAGIEFRQALAGHDDRNVTAVTAVIDDRMRHIEFFNSAAVKNVTEAMAMRCEGQNDFKARADTIAKGREVVLGKTPDTAVQINNNVESPKLEIVLHKG